MKKILAAIAIAALSAFLLTGQVTEKFSTYVLGLPAASSTTIASDQLPILQGGVTERSVTPAILFNGIPLFSNVAAGTVQASGGGTTNFLRADGAWTAPPVFTATVNGYAPFSGGGTANFLRADGTWTVPPASGGGGTLTLGTTAISGGTNGRPLYDNAGLLGELVSVPVTVGGTGLTTLTNHGVLVGAGAAAITQLPAAAVGGVLAGQGVTSDPAFSATPTLGVNATTTGQLTLANGGVSGAAVTIQNNSATAGYNFNLPATPGSAGQVLTSQAGGSFAMTWTSVTPGTSVTNSLGADVALNNTANYFDGPSVAQGTSGTWFCSGTITLIDSAAAFFNAKLWDGTTVISSAQTWTASGNGVAPVSLSGVLASPAANIRISGRDTTNTTGSIKFNLSGNSKDSTLTCIRIA